MSTISVKLQNGSWASINEIASVQHPISGRTILIGKTKNDFVFAVHSNLSGEPFRGSFIGREKMEEIKPLFDSNDFDSINEQKDELLS